MEENLDAVSFASQSAMPEELKEKKPESDEKKPEAAASAKATKLSKKQEDKPEPSSIGQLTNLCAGCRWVAVDLLFSRFCSNRNG
jgi:hypothetical protein